MGSVWATATGVVLFLLGAVVASQTDMGTGSPLLLIGSVLVIGGVMSAASASSPSREVTRHEEHHHHHHHFGRYTEGLEWSEEKPDGTFVSTRQIKRWDS